jgi:hypothetical protein
MRICILGAPLAGPGDVIWVARMRISPCRRDSILILMVAAEMMNIDEHRDGHNWARCTSAVDMNWWVGVSDSVRCGSPRNEDH